MTIEFYENRIVAYADILGWKNASNDLSQYSRLSDAVQKIVDYAAKFSDEIKQALRNTQGVPEVIIEEHGSIEFSFFSDNFAVSAPVDYGWMIFKILSFACHDLLREKFLVRGGVTMGNLFHRRGIIFGPALVEAVALEQDKPSYPCLLCSKELGQYLEQANYTDKVVLTDRNQKLVVNIACGSPLAKDDLMAIIEREISAAKDFTDKWQYLREILPQMYELLAISDRVGKDR